MPDFIGFTVSETEMIIDFMDRFATDGHSLVDLELVEKTQMPGYCGLVVPKPTPCGRDLSVTLLLTSCDRFTIAHELAHVADIAVRRQETLDHIAWRMPDQWQLAHRMSSEYYANRTACRYVDEAAVFPVFQTDRAALVGAADRGDWITFLISYALLLGLFHGLDRTDCEPLRLVAGEHQLPAAVRSGIDGFRVAADGLYRSLLPAPAEPLRVAA